MELARISIIQLFDYESNSQHQIQSRLFYANCFYSYLDFIAGNIVTVRLKRQGER